MSNLGGSSLLETDRIVEINGFSLFVHDNHRIGRRNVKCYSKKLNDFIENNNLTQNNFENKMLISELLNNNRFDDIVVIDVKGYY